MRRSLQDLYVDIAEGRLYAEQKITKALPKMAKAAQAADAEGSL